MRRPITEREKKIYEKNDFYKRTCKALKIMSCAYGDRNDVLFTEREGEFPNEDTLTYDLLYRRMGSGIVKLICAYEETNPTYKGCEEQDLKALRRSLVNVLEGWTTIDQEATQMRQLFQVFGYTRAEVQQEAFATKWAAPVCPYDECHDEDEEGGEEGEDAV